MVFACATHLAASLIGRYLARWRDFKNPISASNLTETCDGRVPEEKQNKTWQKQHSGHEYERVAQVLVLLRGLSEEDRTSSMPCGVWATFFERGQTPRMGRLQANKRSEPRAKCGQQRSRLVRADRNKLSEPFLVNKGNSTDGVGHREKKKGHRKRGQTEQTNTAEQRLPRASLGPRLGCGRYLVRINTLSIV